MKFKAPGDEPISIGLTSGHTLVITPDGTEVPPKFRREAIARDCKPVGVSTEENVSLDPEKDRAALIRAAIEKLLDGDDEGNFDADDKPNVRKLSAAAGFDISKGERNKAWTAYEAELKQGSSGEVGEE